MSLHWWMRSQIDPRFNCEGDTEWCGGFGMPAECHIALEANEQRHGSAPPDLEWGYKPHDVSPDFRWDRTDAQTIKKILPHEGTPEAVKAFARYSYRLTDYGYWFLLSTLWVNYTGWSDLELWKRLFSSARSRRQTSIMKPSELAAWEGLADPLQIYRAHRDGEADWIAYTLRPETAAKFAGQRGAQRIAIYEVDKRDVLALFLRRGEHEVLVLDRTRARFVDNMEVISA